MYSVGVRVGLYSVGVGVGLCSVGVGVGFTLLMLGSGCIILVLGSLATMCYAISTNFFVARQTTALLLVLKIVTVCSWMLLSLWSSGVCADLPERPGADRCGDDEYDDGERGGGSPAHTHRQLRPHCWCAALCL